MDQTMKAMEIIDRLEDLLEEGGKAGFLLGRSSNKEEMMQYIQDLRVTLPSQIQQAVWIVEERNKLLAQAEKEKKIILEEAEESIRKMVNNHEITKYAEVNAQEILDEARKDARKIQNGANDYRDEMIEHANYYADETIQKVEKRLKMSLEVIHQEAKEFEAFLGDVLNQVQQDRGQLKEDLIAFKEKNA